MFCAISGQIPEEPVVSKKTGHLFEKRLILKSIEATGKCPVTGVELSKDDLIEVHSSSIAKPRPVEATSIPGLLNALQNEWDSLMLESFSLKKQLHDIRQEFAQALYQHEAACRVIARLVKERDEARNALATYFSLLSASIVPSLQSAPAKAPEAAPKETMEVDSALPAPVVEEITTKAQSLTQQRKKVLKAKKHPDVDVIKGYTAKETISIHEASAPSVNSIATRYSNKDLLLTGGEDSQVLLYSRENKQILKRFTGHTKEITKVLLHPTRDIYLSASADATVRVWNQNSELPTIFTQHKAAVTDLDLHATQNYFVDCSRDGTWNYYDLNRLSLLYTGHLQDTTTGYSAMKFHPDGLLLGGAYSNVVEIYDMRNCSKTFSFQNEQLHDISSLAFSENGFSMAVGTTNGQVQLYDLRKNQCVHTYEQSSPIYSVQFDNIGVYLAIGSDRLQVKATKSWEDIFSSEEQVNGYKSLAWSDEASELFAGCGNGNLVSFSA